MFAHKTRNVYVSAAIPHTVIECTALVGVSRTRVFARERVQMRALTHSSESAHARTHARLRICVRIHTCVQRRVETGGIAYADVKAATLPLSFKQLFEALF